MDNQYDYIFKIIVIGNPGVGKSSILNSLIDNKFDDQYGSTLGIDFRVKTMKIDNKNIKLLLWDTAGQERFKTITSPYYRNVHGVVLVYDITDRKSFQDLNIWLHETDKYCHENVIKIIIGNKTDIEEKRMVSYKEGKDLANDLGMIFIETSAKTLQNVEDVFVQLVNEIKKDIINHDIEPYQKTRPIMIMKKKYNNNEDVCGCP
jgi:Ras-related protein Rab-1A